MKYLIVAHPDDEILWFGDPRQYDRIVIVFGPRGDKPDFAARRRNAMANHPLRDRIVYIGAQEPLGSKTDREEQYTNLCEYLKDIEASEVTTHNAMGEYQHADHLMLFNACMATLDCPVNGQDPALFREIKKAYTDAGCWTWH